MGDKYMKNVPQRTCVGCMQKKDQNELIRIVKDKKQEVSIDIKGKSEGRGIYICKNLDCLERVIKNKKIEKTFETKISEEIYNNLRGVIFDK